MSNGIYQAITNAMNEVSPIAKGKRNREQGFSFRGIDDVMNELHSILSKNKIFIYPEVINVQRQERTTSKGSALLYSVLTIKYHFAHEDGSEVTCIVVGEGMDSGDKASNKAMAVAFKYACLQMFCIPTDEMADPDSTTPPESVPKSDTPHGTPPPKNANEKKTAGEIIGEILNTKDPDCLPFFNQKEIEIERAIFMKSSMPDVEKQYYRLKGEFEKRKASFCPAPFGDEPKPTENFIQGEINGK
ncbi:MAG: ERF family protein [Treponema sp.]|nr:ERF family protein [Treponema sp.]